MKINTEPMVDAGTPCVRLQVGDLVAQLTARQAEEIAESLSRAATAARYEAGIAEMLARVYGRGGTHDKQSVAMVRQFIEQRRIQGN